MINVTLVLGAELSEMTIKDNGKGFDTEKALKENGIGITSMREHAARIGGKIDFISQIGNGAEVTVTVPRIENQLD